MIVVNLGFECLYFALSLGPLGVRQNRFALSSSCPVFPSSMPLLPTCAVYTRTSHIPRHEVPL